MSAITSHHADRDHVAGGPHWPTAEGFEELALGAVLFAGAAVAAVMLLLLIVI
jgi:hypothetical protein